MDVAVQTAQQPTPVQASVLISSPQKAKYCRVCCRVLAAHSNDWGSSPSPGGRRASISGALTTQVDDGASPVALRPRRQSTGSIPAGVLSTASPRSAAAHVKAQAPAADHESGTGGASPSNRITATTGSESGEIKDPVDDLQKVAAETPATGTAVAA